MSQPQRVAAGVDLGGTNLKIALIAEDGRLLGQSVEPTRGEEGQEAVLRRIAFGIRRLSAALPIGWSVEAVGVGLPADLDTKTGIVRELPNLPGRWMGVPVAALLGAAIGLPVFLINDAKAFALAEHTLGAATGMTTAICVTVGTGIGSGIVANGRLLFGLGDVAGEIGHLILQPDGPRCTCGNRGCLEALASGPAIAAEAVRRILQGFSTDLLDRAGGDLNRVTPELIAGAAAAGDPVAIQVLEDAASWLGIALAGVVAVLAPEAVVIGGGVAGAGERYLGAVERSLRDHLSMPSHTGIAVRPAALGYDAGAIGAALWAFRAR